jgi:hypothetical protein
MTTTAVATPALPLPSPLPSTAPRQLAEYICHWTPSSFRQAIRDTDGQPFLYRGAESNQEEEVHHIIGSRHSNSHSHTGIISRNEKTTATTTTEWIRPEEPLPDLLFLETHGYDQRALEYFEGLEQRLKSKRVLLTTGNNNIINNINNNSASPFVFMAMPSNGHIATSDPHEASKWGTMVVSVWPVGSQWSYVWPRNRSVFYDYNDDHSHHYAEGHVTTRNSTAANHHHHHHGSDDMSSFSSDGSHDDNNNDDVLMINTGIQDALQQPREVLFATNGWTNQTIVNQIPQGKKLPTGQFPTSTFKVGEGATRRDAGMDTTTITTTTRIVAPSAFLAVPMDRDNELRKELEALNYGLTTRGDGTKGKFGMPGTPIGW